MPGFPILAALVALAACGGNPPAPTAPTASVAIPSSAPSQARDSPSTSASFNTSVDPELAAKFPKTIDGQPVTNVQTFRFVELMAAIGTPKATVDTFTALTTQAGIDPNGVILGTAEATVGGKSQVVQALRSPGADANRFVQALVALARQRGVGASATSRSIALSGSTVGGKNVQVATSADLTQYYYPTGDTVFILNNVDATTAGTILASIP
jgi:hypothetical protein